MKNSVKTALDIKKDLLSLIDYVKCYHPEIFRMIPLSMSVDDLKKNTEVMSDHYIECLNMIGSVDIIDERDVYDGRTVDIMPYILGEKDFAEYENLLGENFERLKEIDERSRQKGSILGRYVEFAVADGKAFYQTRKISGNEVYLVHCPGIHPDDYMEPFIDPGNTFHELRSEKEAISAVASFFAFFGFFRDFHGFLRFFLFFKEK